MDPGMAEFLGGEYRRIVTETDAALRALPVVHRYAEAEFALLKAENNKKRKPKPDEELWREAVSFTSNKDLANMIYGRPFYSLPVIREFKTAKGEPQVTADVFEFFLDASKGFAPEGSETRTFLQLVARLKTFNKLLTTYIDSLPEKSHEGSYKPEFNLSGTITGRLSSGFHTVPSKSDYKRVFVSRWEREGGLFLCGDQSQLEVRVGASIANERTLIDAYLAGADVHRDTAARIYRLTPEEVSADQREHGKRVNFGVFYGKTKYSLAADLGITPEEAQLILDGFFRGRDNLRSWIDGQHRLVERDKRVSTPFGRIIPVPDANSTDPKILSHAHNCSVNYPVQSAASDILVVSNNSVYQDMKRTGARSLFLGSVHDSLEYDVYPGELVYMIRLVKEECENRVRSRYPFIRCPLVMDISIGRSWGGGIEFKVKDLGEDYVVLEGTGLRKDHLQLEAVASRAYDYQREVITATPTSPKDFAEDIFVRDAEFWKARVILRTRKPAALSA
jgi:hypothetical protein